MVLYNSIYDHDEIWHGYTLGPYLHAKFGPNWGVMVDTGAQKFGFKTRFLAVSRGFPPLFRTPFFIPALSLSFHSLPFPILPPFPFFPLFLACLSLFSSPLSLISFFYSFPPFSFPFPSFFCFSSGVVIYVCCKYCCGLAILRFVFTLCSAFYIFLTGDVLQTL